MARVKITEDYLVGKIAALDVSRKALKKKLQVMRIRAAAQRRKGMLKSIRKNEKEVVELLKAKAPEFFDKLTGGSAGATRGAKRRTGKPASRPSTRAAKGKAKK